MNPPDRVVPQIPDHELLHTIGGGSYGEVWLARNVMGTYRAVKIVYRATFDSDRPFEREFAGIQKFEPVSRSHDGLVDILQIGRNDAAGYFYYVMELADDAAGAGEKGRKGAGENVSLSLSLPFSPASYSPHTLASEITRCGRLPYEECLPLFLSLASALAHLHKHGLIHRDIKPSNIIFVKGLAKLADIGLVTEAGDATSYVGTEGYIPPEGPGTRQADIFSLGKLFYELSTGLDRTKFPSLPIEADDLAANKGLLELNAIFVKACASDVRQRYQSAEEMHADLALLQSGRSVKRQRFIERRLAQATRGGVVATVLLLVITVAYLFAESQRRIARENWQRAEELRERAQRAEQEARVHADDATAKLWGAYLAQARASRRSGQMGQRVAGLQAIAQAAALRPAAELRNEAIATLALTDLRPLHTFKPAGEAPRWLDFDPALERLLVIDVVGNLKVTSLLGEGRGERAEERAERGERRGNLSPHFMIQGIATGTLRTVLWSRDGRFLAVLLADQRLQVWDLDAGGKAWELAAEEDAIFHAFTPDSKSLLVGHRDLRARYLDVMTGQVTREVELPAYPYLFRLSPDGRQFAFLDARSNRIEIAGSDDGVVHEGWVHPGSAREIDWSPDGTSLITAGLDQNLYVWNRTNGELRQTLRGHLSVPVRLRYLQRDDLVASSSWDSTLRLWDPRTGRQLLNVPGLAYPFDFNPANGRLGFQVATDGHARYIQPTELRIFELLRNEVVKELVEPKGPGPNGPWCLAFSPDERWLASGSVDGVRIWDLAQGKEMAHLPGAQTLSVFFDWTGENLITCSHRELLRWPVKSAPDGEVVLGPPAAQIPSQAPRLLIEARLVREGNYFVSTDGGRVRGCYQGTNLVNLPRSEGAYHIDVSPDGRWLATADRWDTVVKLFRTRDGSLVRSLPLSQTAEVAFSPDSRWLLTGSWFEYTFWDVESGRPGLRLKREEGAGLQGPMAFSRDGRVLALAISQWVVALVDPASGGEFARLEHPNAQLISALEFSPSGRRLAVATQGHLVQVWDLQKLRAELAALKLDWDQPPFPREPKADEGRPVRAKVLNSFEASR